MVVWAQFLRQTSDNWPEQPNTHMPDGNQIQDELKAEFRRNFQKVSTNYTSAPETSVESVIDLYRYSDVIELFHVTVLVLRFIRNLKATRTRPGIKEEAESLSLEEVAAAENLWLEEIQRLLVKSSKFDQLKVSLHLIIDENVIYRCSGRLKHAPLPYNSRCPVLLPAEHPVTQLIIKKRADKVIHNGVQNALTDLRQKYYVCKGRQVVKKLINKCVSCQKLEAKPSATLPATDLPQFRLSDDFAFTSCDVKFCGPMFIQDIFSKDSTMHKIWVVLFTSASSRAVRLDIVPSLHSQPFIHYLHRFFARRGVAILFISDNGSFYSREECSGDIIYLSPPGGEASLNELFVLPSSAWRRYLVHQD